MQGTVLGARGNTKSEHRRSLPARSSQSRKGGETRYTISGGDTSRRSECRKPDTSAVGHRAPWGCFWSEAWARVQRGRRRGLRGGSHLGERASLAEERRARRQEPTRNCGNVWAAVRDRGRATQSGKSRVATGWTAQIRHSGGLGLLLWSRGTEDH